MSNTFQNLDLEQAVLAALLTHPLLMPLAMERLAVDHFTVTRHRELWRFCGEIFTAAGTLDRLLLSDAITKAGLASEAGSSRLLDELQGVLTDWIGQVLTPEQFTSHLEGLENYRQKRFLQQHLGELQSMLKTHEVQAVQEHALQGLMRDGQSESPSHGLLPVHHGLSDVVSDLADDMANPYRMKGLPCGFQSLDELTRGFRVGSLNILAARPGMGKTTLALNMALKVVQAHHQPVLFFSFEMSRSDLCKKLIQALMGVRVNAELLQSARQALEALPLLLDDTGHLSMSQIRLRLKQAMAQHGKPALVVIDYLGLITPDSHYQGNRVQEVSAISRALKSLAMETGCPFLVLSQLSRGVEGRTDKRPTLSDLRDSGAIEQDADAVMLIYRDDYYNKSSEQRGVMSVDLAKHRYGTTGPVSLTFQPHLALVSDPLVDQALGRCYA